MFYMNGHGRPSLLARQSVYDKVPLDGIWLDMNEVCPCKPNASILLSSLVLLSQS